MIINMFPGVHSFVLRSLGLRFLWGDVSLKNLFLRSHFDMNTGVNNHIN